MSIDPGRFTRTAIHCDAGEAELRLSPHGNWQLNLRGTQDRDWRLACSGSLEGGKIAAETPTPSEPVRLGRLLIDFEGRRAFIGEREVDITGREFQLLALLASEPNRVFGVEEIQRRALDYKKVRLTCRTITTVASRLRCKLRQAGAEGLIVNCSRIGYKLWEGTPVAGVAVCAHD